MIDPADEAVVAAQLGRPPRGVHAVGHRCPCGNPDVVTTEPRLDDGTPFPTTFYLTCPRVASMIGTLEASGLMKEMTDRLAEDAELAAAYQRAHEAYLEVREGIGHVPEIAGVSAGGMPTRVKCLHVLAAHALAAGRGVNPLGDEVLDRLGEWWASGPCVRPDVEPTADVEPVETPHPDVEPVETPHPDVEPVETPHPVSTDPTSGRRVASIDCGTNTIKLLVADLDRTTGAEHQLVREMRIVRLGQDVDRTGLLSEEALGRTFAAVEEYAAIIERHHVDEVRFCATSAARDAGNGDVFREGVRERLGVEPEVLTGDEEAQLSYDGATRSLSDVPAPILVLDIGGGSTELILGDSHGHVRAARSLDIGSVRLTERLMPSDPPTAEELAAATKAVDDALDTLADNGVRIEDAGTVVGVAGTITTLAVVHLGLDHWDHDRVHHARVPVEDVLALTDRMLEMTVAEREALHIPAGRSDVIGAGALILARVLRRARADALMVSDSDILDGIAWSLA